MITNKTFENQIKAIINCKIYIHRLGSFARILLMLFVLIYIVGVAFWYQIHMIMVVKKLESSSCRSSTTHSSNGTSTGDLECISSTYSSTLCVFSYAVPLFSWISMLPHRRKKTYLRLKRNEALRACYSTGNRGSGGGTDRMDKHKYYLYILSPFPSTSPHKRPPKKTEKHPGQSIMQLCWQTNWPGWGSKACELFQKHDKITIQTLRSTETNDRNGCGNAICVR